MVASVSSVVDLVNNSLKRIGYKKDVGTLFEGSEASKIALDVYGQTRDEFLRDSNFEFANRSVALTLLKQAPVEGYIPPKVWSSLYPPLPWMFEYAYPDDCLKVRSVRESPIFIMNHDPQPIVYLIANDSSYTPARRVILCNIPNAILNYTGQIMDLTNWDVGAIEGFAAALGRRIAPALVGLNAVKFTVEDEQTADMAAEKGQG
jgi:hypothetical protein